MDELRRAIAAVLLGWSWRLTPDDDVEVMVAFHGLFMAAARAGQRKER